VLASSTDIDRTKTGGAVSAARAERIVWSVLGAVVSAVLVVGIWSLTRSDSLPVFGSVPDFELVERSGRTVTGADFEGRVWVANFIFTSCAGVCPNLSARMAGLREALRDAAPDVRSVSVSVDPARDTPAVLREYARRYGADENGWLFLTGEREKLHRLIQDGFRLSVAERSPQEDAGAGELITHSDRFVLVDRRSRIRGYYRVTEPEAMPQLVHDVLALAAEE
jgi:cytochrome oxidase Cu insertion factor (SCO1/SenC/PrrC family)